MASQPSLFLCLMILLVCMIITTNGLQCHICGQFNDGVGSITPCLNYTDANAHLHLKECPRKTDKFCVVSICDISMSVPHLPQPKLKSTFSIITFFSLLMFVSSEKMLLWLFVGGGAGQGGKVRWAKICLCRWDQKSFFTLFGGRLVCKRYIIGVSICWSCNRYVRGIESTLKVPRPSYVITRQILTS